MTTFFYTQKKGDFQNGTATDFTQKTEGTGESEASQCGTCQGSARGEGVAQKSSGSSQVQIAIRIIPFKINLS